jgi:uncharacterized protein YbcI
VTDAQRAPLGDDVLEAVNDAMVALHERHHGRRPATSRTQMSEDMLVCRLGGVYTEVEKTLIELEQAATVQETRSVFQHAVERRFITAVEGLTHRRVRRFVPVHHVGPDLEFDLFFLEG